MVSLCDPDWAVGLLSCAAIEAWGCSEPTKVTEEEWRQQLQAPGYWLQELHVLGGLQLPSEKLNMTRSVLTSFPYSKQQRVNLSSVPPA